MSDIYFLILDRSRKAVFLILIHGLKPGFGNKQKIPELISRDFCYSIYSTDFLIQFMNHQSRPQFWFEPGCFWWHNISAVGNVD